MANQEDERALRSLFEHLAFQGEDKSGGLPNMIIIADSPNFSAEVALPYLRRYFSFTTGSATEEETTPENAPYIQSCQESRNEAQRMIDEIARDKQDIERDSAATRQNIAEIGAILRRLQAA